MNVTKIISQFEDAGSLFTSINKLLRPDEGNQAGWRVGVPGQANFTTQGNEVDLWRYHQPESKTEVVAVVRHGRLHAVASWSGIMTLSASVGDMGRTWNGNGGHCSGNRNLSVSASPTNPLKTCKLEYRCRSFYFNAKMSKCYMTLYVDSLLSSEEQGLQPRSDWDAHMHTGL
ncbi:hypothetical protein FGIG_08566 [Fasciola gigantica]|uniref:Apple domain-containing protein n=1 Tax=Fasciola gigantica TaxID=46835 RepID=A0A504YYF5_FASGI|nr:hypothetical protein FGIG_08566 [Fasciola gigantica]